VFIFVKQLKTKDMKAKQMIKNEMDLRMSIVNDKEFRLQAVEVAKKLGITAQEWNENKAIILLFMANEMISMDNKNESKLRNKLGFN
jgi:hypothetical protein